MRRVLVILTTLLMLSAGPAGARGRVIVLGFDGASADLVEKWMGDGTLPNLARLKAQGTYSPLLSTNPPQSPIAWASFATGTNPGKTNQFDFLARNPKDYHIDLALAHADRKPLLLGEWNPLAGASVVVAVGLVIGWWLRRRPMIAVGTLIIASAAGWGTARWITANLPTFRAEVVTNTRGTPFWEIAAERGLHAMAIDVPDTFPPRAVKQGEVLSGLGVPDIRGTIGTYTVYTTDPSLFAGQDPELGGKIVVVSEASSVDTYVPGPVLRDPRGNRNVNARLKLTREGEALQVKVNDDPSFKLEVGQWSAWQEVEFRPFPLFPVHGVCRFYLTSMKPDLQLYMSPVNWSPRHPPSPLSYPAKFASDLADQLGIYETLGWKFATWPLNGGMMDEATYLVDSIRTEQEGERRALHLLAQKPDLFIQVFAETDCMQHMFYRLIDPHSPSYNPALAQKFGESIHASYQRMDQMVGKVQATMSPEDTLYIVSDHGFAPYRRAVNLNRWLVDNGFMQQKDAAGKRQNLENLFVLGDFWPGVDWSKTRAYAFGLGQIYINLEGREAHGIVKPADYDRVRAEIEQKLKTFTDPVGGAPVVANVYRREEIYKGPYVDDAPDLRVAFNKGYRVSWQDSMGGIDDDLIDNNDTRWSGDHCSSDPRDVKGVLFCSRALQVGEQPRIIDVAPTILKMMGVEVPADMDGKPLL